MTRSTHDAASRVRVAGGIGNTPFLSALRTMESGHGRTVRLHGCVRISREAWFLDAPEARAAGPGGVTTRLIASELGAWLDAGGAPGGWRCWHCAPRPLAAVSRGLAGPGVSLRNIHTEAFELR